MPRGVAYTQQLRKKTKVIFSNVRLTTVILFIRKKKLKPGKEQWNKRAFE